jgi:hypothetical protein
MLCAKDISIKDIPAQLLLPVFLISFAVCGFFVFQTTLLVSDRAAITAAYTDQAKTLEQVEKVRAQAGALAKGVFDLDKQGNKNAHAIVEDLKKAGVSFQDDAPKTGAAPAAKAAAPVPPAPAADEK